MIFSVKIILVLRKSYRKDETRAGVRKHGPRSLELVFEMKEGQEDVVGCSMLDGGT